ncbi:tRNA (guanosine(46)-N7)-methyltransferase TrmB [Roseivirga pacifica]|uniref:tRNA (guanosine(46)-N7)-methyltransferase TrmB n=1 Tax=Roseivirga pacifica TaxID=1267423 RepID=UPI002095DF8A|nr:tRNA (guanosine(46)-N7)-methyltransferase TrmB [Roseivirga pacifica]MCO6360550.1 tRNA (guanosine(46)-N7)-methyltransferase TrmB [Roseivirga pacifica]MCO6368439.1 tRNA (guanosine(46)-N7)-methyltransferase TrmB [Roseivirga pacifica]MCO6372581.1 tRNA (guanosine(46)-N7)-methyltransferase TrmB [Roseivirga pacifica]MCO6376639.1 tRNA (guanosine(46)-N7)-methyltransferase TrmB [Roseivirga pacifica]MCO6378081.1 tRNA (guanosine(46)-N7)-methyltransferase TrmB [Roseivirga pacifica]
MGRSKLKRFAENLERENILQDDKPNFDKLKGNWNKEHFKNDLPLIVELGCGKGEYSVGLAERFPQNNFIGVDVKGDRLWVGSTEAIEKGIDTVAFLRAQIQQIDTFFDENEVSEFWITFPDPRPKKRDIKRRLTSPRFLEMYKKLLKPEGIVNFKTDNTALFEYTLETLQERKDIKDLKFTFDLYNSDLQEYTFGIKTTFEKKYLEKGVEIKYMQFKFA